MGETLDGALAALFGGGSAPREQTVAGAAADTVPAGSPEFRALAATARGHYQAALTAQREGDWARYGEEIRKLGEVLARMGDRPR
jgi:uncharacterized membrane protein (UPF0182 family)